MRASEFIVEGVAEGSLNEYRDQLWTWVQSKFPRTQWPEYVQRDFLYAKAKGNKNQKDLEDFLDEIQRDFGNCKWTLTKIPITLDIFTPKTQRMIQSREGGSSNPFQVPKDAERHAQQSQMIQQKGVSAEPIIVAKLANGYDLIEGWHRTIQHLKAFPQGYTGPAWVCTGATYTSESVEYQEVDEGWKEVAVGGALALGALGGTYTMMKPTAPASAPQQVQQQVKQFTPLSNNPQNEMALLKSAKASGMKGPELAQFMAQTKHESWDFSRLKEKAQPGVKGYFAKKYDPKFSPKTAKILGNKKVGDGEKYHGRGFIQLTGRDNYRMAGQALNIDLLNNPDLAAEPEVASKIALWYWNSRVKPHVQNFNDTSAVTRKINPAGKGLEDRQSNFKDYMSMV